MKETNNYTELEKIMQEMEINISLLYIPYWTEQMEAQFFPVKANSR